MDYSKKTRKELLAICKENKIKGYCGKKKQELLDIISCKLNLAILDKTEIVDDTYTENILNIPFSSA